MYKTVASLLRKNLFSIAKEMVNSHFSKNLIQEYSLQKKENLAEIQVGFVEPLLKLLIEYFESGKEEILYVYLDERRRYSPHLAPLDLQLSYHSKMVESDFNIIASILSVNNFISREIWDIIHESLTVIKSKCIKLLAVGDCLMNEVRVFAHPEYKKKDFSIDFRCIYFSSGNSGALDSESIVQYVKNNNIDLISFSFFSFEALPNYGRIIAASEKMSVSEIEHYCDSMIDQVKALLLDVRSKINNTMLIHNVSGLPLSRWRKRIPFLVALNKHKQHAVDYLNKAIVDVVNNVENCILIDEYAAALNKGIKLCSKSIVSQRKYGGMFHTSYFGKYLADIYIQEAEFFLQMKKCKALLVDFDNTLWQGVMADGDVVHLHKRQKLLKELKESGIILVAVSKNTESNIRWDEMHLKKSDFALLQIHWNSKAESVSAAAKILNLGIDSFVFVDDNRHERAIVRDAYSNVVLLDADLKESWGALERLKFYPNTQATEEARQRTEMYQQQAARNAAFVGGESVKDNLLLLNLWYTFMPAQLSDLDRIVELVNRTNQFNLTTKRYSKEELIEFIKSKNYKVYVSSLGDKYGNLGVVSVIIVELIGADLAFIDSFVMSCRAMGFSLEKALVFNVIESLKDAGFARVQAEYVQTDRNLPCASLYSDLNFTEILPGKKYEVDLNKHSCDQIEWLFKK